jgi:hypothetical protein
VRFIKIIFFDVDLALCLSLYKHGYNHIFNDINLMFSLESVASGKLLKD